MERARGWDGEAASTGAALVQSNGGVAQGGGVPWPGIKGTYSDKKKQGYNDWQGSDLGDLRKPGSV